MPEPDHLGVTITGIDSLSDMMQELGYIGTRSSFTAALRKAVKPIALEANIRAPRGPDDAKPLNKRLKGSFRVGPLSRSQKRKRGPKRYPVEVFVGSTRAHAHLVEFGHRLVRGKTRKGTILKQHIIRDKRGRIRRRVILERADDATVGRVVGHVPPHPVLGPVMATHGKEATRTFFKLIGDEMRRTARRYRGQAERGKLSRGARQAFKVPL